MAYIIRRRQSWFAQVNRRGVRRSRSFPTRRAAQVWADELEAALLASGERATAVTVTDVIERYRTEVGSVRPWGAPKASALSACQRSLGHLTLPELTVEALKRHATARRHAGVGPSTITHDLSCLSACLKLARLLWGYDIPPGLASDARAVLSYLGLAARSRARTRVIGAPELDRIERAWLSNIPFDLIRFARASAMRRGEILRLRWDDYDPAFRSILVRDRKHPRKKLGNHQLVPLLGEAAAILDRQPRSGDLAWPYEPKQLYRAWLAATRDAGVTDARFHDLRHTGITDLFRAGWKINEVAIVSGHQDWASLKRYEHMQAADLIEIETRRKGAHRA